MIPACAPPMRFDRRILIAVDDFRAFCTAALGADEPSPLSAPQRHALVLLEDWMVAWLTAADGAHLIGAPLTYPEYATAMALAARRARFERWSVWRRVLVSEGRAAREASAEEVHPFGVGPTSFTGITAMSAEHRLQLSRRFLEAPALVRPLLSR